jgi:hypothetical protein
VHVEDRLQLGGAQVGQAAIAHDPCVVDQHVHRVEGAQRLLDDRLSAGFGADRVRAGECLAAPRSDLVNYGCGSADVVDHDPRAAAGQFERIGATEAATGSGHDRHAASERDRAGDAHRSSPPASWPGCSGESSLVSMGWARVMCWGADVARDPKRCARGRQGTRTCGARCEIPAQGRWSRLATSAS